MSKEEMFFEIAKSIAPEIVKKGLETQERIIQFGSDPSNCTLDGKDIPHAYGEIIKLWANAIVDELCG